MKVRDFIYISSIPTGITYEQDLIKYFNINSNQSVEDVVKEINLRTKVRTIPVPKQFKLNGKKWFVDQDLMDGTFEQFIRLEQLLAQGNNLINLHKLLAIYCRPTKKFIMDDQDILAEELLELNMEIAQAIMFFFYQNALNSINYMKIAYLNQLNQTKLKRRLLILKKSFLGILSHLIFHKKILKS